MRCGKNCGLNPDPVFRKDDWRDVGCVKGAAANDWSGHGCLTKYYTNFTFIPNGLVDAITNCSGSGYPDGPKCKSKPTMPADSPLRTQARADPTGKGGKINPWWAPGTAPIWSPCGIDGGNPHGCGHETFPTAALQNADGSNFAPGPFGSATGDSKAVTGVGDACAGGGRGHGPDGRELPGNAKPAQ